MKSKPKPSAALQNKQQIESISKSNPKIIFSEVQKSFIFSGILLILLLAVYHKFFFGNFVFLFKDIGSDSYNYTYPLFSHYAEYLRNEGMPQWSFQHGLGQNLHPFWFGPIRVVLWWIFGEKIAESMIFIQIVHLFLAGLFFYFFLRSLNRSFYAALIAGICYAFSGYATLGGSWSPEVFPQEVFKFSFLLFATQQFLSYRRWYYFPLAVGLVAIYQPFNLYFAAICVLVHCFLFLYQNDDFQPKNYLKTISWLVILGIFGIFLSAFQSWSNILQLLDNPRVSGDFSYADNLAQKTILGLESAKHYSTAILRFFSADMLGSAMLYQGWNNYMEAPVFYCGLISLLLLPQIFVWSKAKNRKIYIFLLVLVLLIIIFPTFRYTFWLYTGDYYRTFCLLVVILLLVVSSLVLDKIYVENRINIIALTITLGVLFFLLVVNRPPNQSLFEISLFRKVFIFLIIESLLIWGVASEKSKKPSMILLFLMVSFELVSFSRNSVYERKIVSKTELRDSGYNDGTREVINYLSEKDKGFYRIEKNYSSGIAEHLSFNDAHIQGYFGSRSYHSFNQSNYVNFLRKMELVKPNDEYGTRWLEGIMFEPYLQRLFSMKYYLTKIPNISEFYNGLEIDSLMSMNGIKILKIKHSLPLGLTYSNLISETDFSQLSTQNKRKILYKATVINDELSNKLPKITINDSLKSASTIVFDIDFVKKYTAELQKDTLSELKFSNNFISGKVNINQDKILFLAIPYDNGWSATVNGKEVSIEKINIGFLGIFLKAGQNEIKLQYETPFLGTARFISIFAFVIFFILIGYFFWKRRKANQLV